MRKAPILVLSIAIAAASACAPQPHERRPRAEHDDDDGQMHKGVAQADQWLSVEGFGARVRVPKGWEYGTQGPLVLGTEAQSRAAFLFVGAGSVADAKKKYQIGLDLLKMDLGASSLDKRSVVLHGLAFERQDYAKATVAGRPAHGVALVGDAPGGRHELLLFLGYSLDGEPDLDKQLAAAIESISQE